MNNSAVVNAIGAGRDAGSDPGLLVAAVIGIILASGLIGGVAAYLTDVAAPADGEKRASSPPWFRFVLLGIIAAACVPLFLSLVKSRLLGDIFASDANPFEPILVFTGLCLIAAFSARAFIDSISRRVLQQVEQIKEKQVEVEKKTKETGEIAEKAATTAKAAQETVDDQRAEPVEQGKRLAALRSPAQHTPMGDEEQRVLHAVAAKTYRTVTGVTEDSGLDRSQVKAVLQALSQKGLVEPTISPSGGLRWKLAAPAASAGKQP